MKIFELVGPICYRDLTPLFSNSKDLIIHNPIVEAPDYVMEGWGYNGLTKEFIKPTPQDGWFYDEKTGTLYPKEYNK